MTRTIHHRSFATACFAALVGLASALHAQPGDPGDPDAPTSPSGLVATPVNNSSIALTWIDNSNNEDGFEIERSTTSGSGFVLIFTTGSDVTSYADVGLSSGTTYYYRVRAFAGPIVSGASGYTPQASATTTSLGYDFYEGAIDVTSLINTCSSDAQFSTVSATPDRNANACVSGSPIANRWFKFVAPSNGMISITVDIQGAKGNQSTSAITLWQSDGLTAVKCKMTSYTWEDATLGVKDLTPGATYYFTVDVTGAGSKGSFTLCLSNQLDYDFYEGAVDVTSLINTCSSDAQFSTVSATPDRNSNACVSGSPIANRWFKFVAPSNGMISITVDIQGAKGNQSTSAITLWQSDGLTAVKCKMTSYTWEDATLGVKDLTPGATYYFTVDVTGAGSKGSFTLCLSNQLDYDFYEGAVDVTSLINTCSSDAQFTTVSATPDRVKGSCWNNNGPLFNRWFKFTAPTTGRITITVDIGGSKGTQTRSMAALWQADGTTQIACSIYAGYTDDVIVESSSLTPGATYYLSVDVAGTALKGTFSLCLNDGDFNNFVGAKRIVGNSWISADAEFTTANATADGSAGTCKPVVKNVWFKFQATTSEMDVRILTGGSKGTGRYLVLTAYNASGSPIACMYTGSLTGTAYLQLLNLTVGGWYYFSVDNLSASYVGTFTVSTNNSIGYDLMAKAYPITGNSWTSGDGAFSTINATADGTSGSCKPISNNVWFKFQAATNEMEIKVRTGGVKGTSSYLSLTLYNSAGVPIRCHYPSSVSGTAFIQATDLTVGEWYYFTVDNASASYLGTFTVSTTNTIGYDLMSKALVITGNSWNSGDAALSTAGATGDGTSGTCKPIASNVWFKFQATTNEMEIKVETGGVKGTSKYLSLTLYNSAGTPIQCHYFGQPQSTAYIQTASLVVGNWYYFTVDHASSSYVGTFTVSTTNNIGYDLMAKAHLITSNTWNSGDAAFTTAGATADGISGNCKPVASNVWFKFQAVTSEIEVKVQTGGVKGTSNYLSLVLYDAEGVPIKCHYYGQLQNTAYIQTTSLVVGNWYYFTVDHANSSYTGTFTVTTTNNIGYDLMSKAFPITGGNNWTSSNAEFSTTDATADGMSGSCRAVSKNVWFKVQAPSNEGTIKLETGGVKGSLSFALLTLYDASGNPIDCRYPNTTYGTATVQRSDFVVGNWYYYSIDQGGNAGTFSTSVSFTPFDPVGNALENWAFQYKYDGRRRMTHKKVPGADWVYMVFDDRDRLVMTQDGEQRKVNNWSFTKYDALNRPILTGIYTHSSSVDQQQMSDLVSTTNFFETYAGGVNDAITHGYSNAVFPKLNDAAFPNSKLEVLTVTYYDNYNFLAEDAQFAYKANELPGQYDNGSGQAFQQVVGQVTGTKVKTLGADAQWLRTVSYYDDRYRVVQVVADNHVVGIERTTNVYDFVGKVLQTVTVKESRNILWKDLVSAEVLRDRVKNTGGITWGSSGAASVQLIPAGTDGWVEFTVNPGGPGGSLMFGLSDQNVDANITTLDYAVYYIYNSGYNNITVYENGTSKFSYPTKMVGGETIRIERVGSTIKYKLNGIPIYTSTVPENGQLLADLSMSYTTELLNPKISIASDVKSINRTFDYDHAGRLTNTWHQVNGQTPVLLAKNEYNELGQLVDKKLHSTLADGSDAKQSTDYRYNIRGWLTSINNSELVADGVTNDDSNDYFGMNLAYNEVYPGLDNQPLFNGNISAIKWSKNGGFALERQQAYRYAYDAMNRLSKAEYFRNNGSWYDLDGSFLEAGLQYDLNGNILFLLRRGSGGSWQDILNYSYGSSSAKSNRLLSVTDSGDKELGFIDDNTVGNDYEYDSNGNMFVDKNKNITSIVYNHLNRPQTVTKNTGEYIRYVYDAGGRKLSQKVFDSSNQLKKVTDYVGEYIYENDTLRFANTEEGRIILSPVSSELIASYSLDGSVVDSSGNGFNGSLVGGVIDVDRNGNAGGIRLDGVDDYGVIPDNDVFDFGTGDFTVSFWAKKLKPASGWDEIMGVHKWNTGASPGTNSWSLTTGGQNVNNPNFGIESGNTLYSISSPTPLIVGQWHHLVGLRQGDKIKLYIDGQFKGEASVGTAAMNNTSLPIYIGRLPQGLYTNAIYDDLEIFGAALDEETIQKMYEDRLEQYEYQYHLKDHLGNVRLTFTTKEEIDEHTATLETQHETKERAQFLNYDNVRTVNSTLFDHTGEAGTNYALRLNGTTNERLGLAKSLAVVPGDQVHLEVYAKYVDPDGNNWTTALTNLLNAVAGGTAPPGTVIDGAGYSTGGSNNLPFGALLDKDNESGPAPKAYLNYLVFDQNFVLNLAKSGYKRMSEVAKESGNDVPHELLEWTIDITEPGYVYIYLSNDQVDLGGSPVEVYFDDFKVTHTKSPVIQSDEYYPFGLTFNSFKRENVTPNHYLYNGKELQDELSLGLINYGLRLYDPTLGRWITVDPASDMMRRWSPYNYGFDNPIRFVDPDGSIPFPVNKEFKGFKRRVDSWFGPRNVKDDALASKNHKGLDINFGGGYDDFGAPVHTTHDGVVSIVKDNTSDKNGRTLYIESPDGRFRTVYMHLSKITIQEGEHVKEGQVIAEIGASGRDSEHGVPSHLHYQIEIKNDATGEFEPYNPTENKVNKESNVVDPQNWIKKQTREPFNFTYSAPDWAKRSKVGAYIYFFFTGKDSGLPDQVQGGGQVPNAMKANANRPDLVPDPEKRPGLF